VSGSLSTSPSSTSTTTLAHGSSLAVATLLAFGERVTLTQAGGAHMSTAGLCHDRWVGKRVGLAVCGGRHQRARVHRAVAGGTDAILDMLAPLFRKRAHHTENRHRRNLAQTTQ